jgi:hemolysin III
MTPDPGPDSGSDVRDPQPRSALFAGSVPYHRVRWRSPTARRWMLRLDHSMIVAVIADTSTPFADRATRRARSAPDRVWAGAAAGIALTPA